MMSPTVRLVVHGIVSLALGVIAIVWPDVTIGAFVILYAVWAFAAGAFAAMAAIWPPPGGSPTSTRIGQGAIAVLDVAAGVVALAWPGITALVLVVLVAAWALIIGVLQVAMAFTDSESGGERLFFALTGLLAIALAVAFVLRPDIGAATIATVYGFFSIVTGLAMLVTARSIREHVEPLTVG